MSLTTTTTVQPAPPTASQPGSVGDASALLSMALLSVYAAQKSNRKFRKLKRRFLWNAFLLKAKSRFSKKAASSDRTLLYILLGVVFLLILILNPWVALFLALILLILLLTDTIHL